MKVLVVGGFDPGDPGAALVDRAAQALQAGGHEPVATDLAAEGFDRTMTAEERAAYLTDAPLVTAEARRGAELVGAVEGIVVCYRVIAGTAPTRVKSWQERVFVLDVGFRFLPSGRITGALDHLTRACVIALDPDDDRRWRHRNSFGPCLARSFHLSSNRRCRSRYVTVTGAGSASIAAALGHW
ncbi:MAG: NAD(P)H-dependent oxidoreductase [Acidimicrobiales bacterium]